MPLCDNVTENNLSIISSGYDLVVWKSDTNYETANSASKGGQNFPQGLHKTDYFDFLRA